MKVILNLNLFLFSLLFIFGGYGILLASDEAVFSNHEKVSLRDLIQEGYKNNPSILASRKSWRSAIENYRINTAYPDPQIMVTYFTDPIETRLGPQDWNAGLSQMIPFPGKLSKAGEMIQADARIAKFSLDKSVRDVIVGISESYYELLYIRTAKKIANQNLTLLNHLRKIGETAYAKDRANFMDVVKAQSQLGQLQYDIILLDDLEATEIARLNGLLNRPPDQPLGSLQEQPVRAMPDNLQTLYKMAENNQEEIQIAKTAVEKADANLDLAYYQNLPDFKIGLFYASIGDPDLPSPPSDAGKDAMGIQAGMSIPLWFGKNSGRVGKARAELSKAEATKRVRINATHTKIRANFFRLQNANRLMALYQKELLPQAAQSMEIAETWFKEGESSFTDFVEAQAVWYNFQLAYARSRADYGKFFARLERLVGQNLSYTEKDSNANTKEVAK